MHHYRDGFEIERRYITPIHPHNPTFYKTVLVAAFKAVLATAVILALVSGHSDIALAILYLLRLVIEQGV
jgi:hypothetical protein